MRELHTHVAQPAETDDANLLALGDVEISGAVALAAE
jgi:hypothetical protein